MLCWLFIRGYSADGADRLQAPGPFVPGPRCRPKTEGFRDLKVPKHLDESKAASPPRDDENRRFSNHAPRASPCGACIGRVPERAGPFHSHPVEVGDADISSKSATRFPNWTPALAPGRYAAGCERLGSARPTEGRPRKGRAGATTGSDTQAARGLRAAGPSDRPGRAQLAARRSVPRRLLVPRFSFPVGRSDRACGAVPWWLG
jgi:hypothetical protein